MKRRLLTFLIALDCLALALITLGNCKRGETISAALWSLEQDGKTFGLIGRPIVDYLLSWLESNHCYSSWVVEQQINKVTV